MRSSTQDGFEDHGFDEARKLAFGGQGTVWVMDFILMGSRIRGETTSRGGMRGNGRVKHDVEIDDRAKTKEELVLGRVGHGGERSERKS